MNPQERKTYLKDKLLTANCSKEELRELYALVERYGRQEEIDELMKQLWEKDTIAKTLGKKEAAQILTNIQHRTSLAFLKRENQHSKQKYMRIAASIILLISVGFGLYYFQPLPEPQQVEYITKSTQNAQRATFKLSDGSMVMLNAGSSLRFPKVFNDSTRQVTLIGEAFFEVVPNPEKPFMVATANLETRVLGTSFNIRAFDDLPTEVTVATGKVQVAMTDTLMRPSLEDSALILTPRKQLSFDPQDSSILLREVALQPYLAWRENMLYFEMEPFDKVLQSLERWYNVEFQVTDSSANACRIKADYHDESLENVLKGLQLLVDFEYHFVDATHIDIKGKQCKN